MSKQFITAKALRALGFPESPVIPVVMEAVNKHCKHWPPDELQSTLQTLLAQPADFYEDAIWAKAAMKLQPPPAKDDSTQIALNADAVPLTVFGAEGIEAGALQQIQTAARLPVAVAAALMPDAHHGYGLPIGGVLATHQAVIPYGVGVDIGCRMCLSLYDIEPAALKQREAYFTRELLEATLFGAGASFEKPASHAVMDDPAFDALPLLRQLKDKAWRQLGSSGSGNHFAEFGEVTIVADNEVPGVPAGHYLGLLTHSGSRALGANIASHYTQVARQMRQLPPEAANLAWLQLHESAGAEYWLAMNLAGEYAAACHAVIHQKVAKQFGRQPVAVVENHHNFAWIEQWNGQEVVVHRKGATPAGAGVLGIIPGSMTAPGFIVKGRGDVAAIQSAAHGAGRQMSRSRALQSISREALKAELAKAGVKLLGGGLDEAPFAYKDIQAVMQAQASLVDIVGKFQPVIVRMCGNEPKKHRPRHRDARPILDGE